MIPQQHHTKFVSRWNEKAELLGPWEWSWRYTARTLPPIELFLRHHDTEVKEENNHSEFREMNHIRLQPDWISFGKSKLHKRLISVEVLATIQRYLICFSVWIFCPFNECKEAGDVMKGISWIRARLHNVTSQGKKKKLRILWLDASILEIVICGHGIISEKSTDLFTILSRHTSGNCTSVDSNKTCPIHVEIFREHHNVRFGKKLLTIGVDVRHQILRMGHEPLVIEVRVKRSTSNLIEVLVSIVCASI